MKKLARDSQEHVGVLMMTSLKRRAERHAAREDLSLSALVRLAVRRELARRDAERKPDPGAHHEMAQS
jgi:hypothetical protein